MIISFPRNFDVDSFKEEMISKLKSSEIGCDIEVKTSLDDVNITIKKFGTSSFTFERSQNIENTTFTLKEEQIATLHKAFRPMIMQEVSKIVENVGGTVE